MSGEQKEVDLTTINDDDIAFLLEQAKKVDEESIAKCSLVKNFPVSLIKEII